MTPTIETIIANGALIGVSAEWELWNLAHADWHVNIITGKVLPADDYRIPTVGREL